MNRKPILTILSMILILAFVLTGCSSPTPAAPTAAPAQPTAVPAAPEPTAVPAAPEPTAVPAAPEPTKVPEPTAVPEPVSKYKEAPMLEELVKAGSLPPVDERLPKAP
jgi:peptide/nickel transport system substrate-binding protein